MATVCARLYTHKVPSVARIIFVPKSHYGQNALGPYGSESSTVGLYAFNVDSGNRKLNLLCILQIGVAVCINIYAYTFDVDSGYGKLMLHSVCFK